VKQNHKPKVSDAKALELLELQKQEEKYNQRLKEPQQPVDYLAEKPWRQESQTPFSS
jgi:hypothetical protein